MTHLKSHLWVTLAVLVLAVVAWLGNKDSSSATVQTQDANRVLEIERYPNEPLQLVSLRIGPHSVKDRIKPKFLDKNSKWSIEVVKFNEKDDWYKRVSITLRNSSDKPVYGVEGFLFFKPMGFPMIFSLPLTFAKELRRDPLQPGAEIELTVNQGLLNHTLADLKNRSADVSRAVVSFSLDTVIFSDDLKWYRGQLLQPDSATPNKWVPVDEPLAMKSNKPSVTFMRASFKNVAPEPATPAVFATCKEWNGSHFDFVCSGDLENCIRRVDADSLLIPGLKSQVPVSGACLWVGGGTQTCQTQTTHTRFQTDPNCQVCPDADSDGYQSSSCGGADCNDNNANINPGAEEGCDDGVDSDCDGNDPDVFQCDWETCPQTCMGNVNYCIYPQTGCASDENKSGNCCYRTIFSPVVIDVSGNGFNLTNSAGGVNFDLDTNGVKERLSWTAPQTDDAWLALDRNGDGAITDGTELFGNFTPQSTPPAGVGKNGFNALVEFDQPAKGGNGDGLITDRDSVFRNLLLWQDRNHNGISEADELRSLSQHGLKAIECDYKESKKTDEHGNQFRYRAKVRDARNTSVGRWAWDVFLVREHSSAALYIMDPIDRRPSEAMLEWLTK